MLFFMASLVMKRTTTHICRRKCGCVLSFWFFGCGVGVFYFFPLFFGLGVEKSCKGYKGLPRASIRYGTISQIMLALLWELAIHFNFGLTYGVQILPQRMSSPLYESVLSTTDQRQWDVWFMLMLVVYYGILESKGLYKIGRYNPFNI